MMWRVAVIFLLFCCCNYALIDDAFCPQVPKYQPPKILKEIPKADVPNKDSCGCHTFNENIQQPISSASSHNHQGCLPEPKKICPHKPSNKCSGNRQPSLLVCLLPSQLPPAVKSEICTTTSVVEIPCANANKPTATAQAIKSTPSATESKKTEEKGIIPLVKAMFSSPKPTTNTSASDSSVGEKKNSPIVTQLKPNCTCTSIYPESVALPPAVYDILKDMVDKRAKV